jgi:hypothetical protein
VSPCANAVGAERIARSPRVRMMQTRVRLTTLFLPNERRGVLRTARRLL